MFRRRALERGVDEELQFHLDQQTEKYVRAGMSPDEARRQAMLRFGGVVRVQEETRDEIRPALLDDSIRDIRFGARILWRAPGFTVAALATLAIGIGATAAIFSVVRTVMLEPLPYREPGRVVGIWETTQDGVTQNVIAPANFAEWRERSQTLDHLGMVGWTGSDGHRRRRTGKAQGPAVLGATCFRRSASSRSSAGAYTFDEDYGGKDGVIVLNSRVLAGPHGRPAGRRRHSAGDRWRSANHHRVMPPGFTVAGRESGFLHPVRTNRRAAPCLQRTWRLVCGRAIAGWRVVRPGRHRDADIFAQLERDVPERNARRKVLLIPIQEQMVGDVRPACSR